MTKILSFALKIRGVVGRVANGKSSDPAIPPPPKEIETCTWSAPLRWLPDGRHGLGIIQARRRRQASFSEQ